MKTYHLFFLALILVGIFPVVAGAQDVQDLDPETVASGAIFDDQALMDGYIEKYAQEPAEILLAMIADEALGAYKVAAAVHVFKENFAPEALAKEKAGIIKLLIRRLNRSDSPFVQLEIMHTLVVLDRYQYFQNMVPALIQKMDHYNSVVSRQAYEDVSLLIKGSARSREARIIFTSLRKMLFLSRNKLASVTRPDERLRRKLDLLRWSVKVLGTQELNRLPPEVLSLL